MAKDHLRDYDTTAANNTDVDGVNIDEGCSPANVNNGMREQMADTAEFFKDISGQLTTGGAAGAYTLTTNDSVAAYAAGIIYTFVANHTTAGAATLNVNAIGAKTITKNGSLVANSIYVVVYDAVNDKFQVIGSEGFESGTSMPFYQDAAPDGWTIDADVDQHVARLTKGSVAFGTTGGSRGGTHNFGSQFDLKLEGSTPGVGGHVLTTSQIPAHTHSTDAFAVISLGSSGFTPQTPTGSKTTGSTGGGGTHYHSIDLRAKWAAFIVAAKD